MREVKKGDWLQLHDVKVISVTPTGYKVITISGKELDIHDNDVYLNITEDNETRGEIQQKQFPPLEDNLK